MKSFRITELNPVPVGYVFHFSLLNPGVFKITP